MENAWEILRALPDPLGVREGGPVTDPNYGFAIQRVNLTDHFADTQLTDDEAADIRDVKQSHPYMGRMAFPDELNRPARTVVATQLGRETLVLNAGNGKVRRATVRECATIQSFPITYQFAGNTMSSRYRQAGDAVPPVLSYSIAKLIADDKQGLPVLRDWIDELASECLPSKKKRKEFTYKPLRKFAQMIPGKEIRGQRVEFDNLNLSRGLSRSDGAIWEARIHLGEGKAVARAFPVEFDEAFQVANDVFSAMDCEARDSWRELCHKLSTAVERFTATEAELQEVWARNEKNQHSPDAYCQVIADCVNEHFPAEKYTNRRVALVLSGHTVSNFRVRLLAGAVVASALSCSVASNTAGRESLRHRLLSVRFDEVT